MNWTEFKKEHQRLLGESKRVSEFKQVNTMDGDNLSYLLLYSKVSGRAFVSSATDQCYVKMTAKDLASTEWTDFLDQNINEMM